MNTLYMHYRPTDGLGNIEDPRGGATLAIQQIDKENVAVSIAYCSPRDVFKRSTGRAVAEGRLRARLAGKEVNGFFFTIPVADDSVKIKELVHNRVAQTMSKLGYY